MSNKRHNLPISFFHSILNLKSYKLLSEFVSICDDIVNNFAINRDSYMPLQIYVHICVCSQAKCSGINRYRYRNFIPNFLRIHQTIVSEEIGPDKSSQQWIYYILSSIYCFWNFGLDHSLLMWYDISLSAWFAILL